MPTMRFSNTVTSLFLMRSSVSFGVAVRMELVAVLIMYLVGCSAFGSEFTVREDTGLSKSYPEKMQVQAYDSIDCVVKCACDPCCFTAIFIKASLKCTIYDAPLEVLTTPITGVVYFQRPWRICE